VRVKREVLEEAADRCCLLNAHTRHRGRARKKVKAEKVCKEIVGGSKKNMGLPSLSRGQKRLAQKRQPELVSTEDVAGPL